MIAATESNTNTVARRFPAPVADRPFADLYPFAALAGNEPRGLRQHAEILACPRCGGKLDFLLEVIECKWCGTDFESDHGVPRLFFPHDLLYGPPDVTRAVKKFYDANPFPKYGDADSRDDLRKRIGATPLGQVLDEQLPADALILDAGCGTGQMANFLGLQKNRQVIGADISLQSLRHAKAFRDRCAVQNTLFVQMNIFRPVFCNGVFDVVIANSVLDHTSDPLRGFRTLAGLLKPGGTMVLGLYNSLGRFPNRLRRIFHKASKERLAFLNWRSELKRERFVQRYKQPWESRHSMGEVVTDWFAAHDFEFLFSLPRIGSKSLSTGNSWRYPRWPGDARMRFKTELGLLLRGVVNDGTFVMIGRKRAEPKRIESGLLAEAAVA